MSSGRHERERSNTTKNFLKCGLFFAFVLQHAAAFSSTRWQVSLSQFTNDGRTRTAILAVAAIADDETEVTRLTNGEEWKEESGGLVLPRSDSSKTEATLPPWLERHVDLSQEAIDEEIRNLEYALLEEGLDIDHIVSIVNDVCQVSSGDPALTAGILNFLNIFISIHDEGSKHFVTAPVLRASVLHYSECVIAQRNGVPILMQKFLREPLDAERPRLPPANGPDKLTLTSADIVVSRPTSSLHEEGGWEVDEVEAIASGAAQIKRAELLVQTILRNENPQSSLETIRDLLLSMMDDWRSLGIRVVACLYRLDGLVQSNHKMNEYTERTPQVVLNARQALKIYAPLAQRLGLNSLKAKIEDRAFRLLYRRQYDVAQTLYTEGGPLMQALSSYLSGQITLSLRTDPVLMEQLEDLQVVSRVKEPYSFWKKLLKKRLKSRFKSADLSPRSLAITEVNDAVALRVIVKAKQSSSDETPKETRAREELLCYYVQQRIRENWPEIDSNRVKDYISHPKPNGYKSLHHTSMISSGKIKFPFEVQVRSGDMHKRAEFGIAAHWDYKLGSAQRTLEPATPVIVPAKNIGTVNAYVDNLIQAKKYAGTARCVRVHYRRQRYVEGEWQTDFGSS